MTIFIDRSNSSTFHTVLLHYYHSNKALDFKILYMLLRMIRQGFRDLIFIQGNLHG
jgi:hypothetical protein